MVSALALDSTFLSPHARILVAVSGGADSLALLLALHLQPFDIAAAHVNHGLRGTESDDDERFVCELCDKMSIELATRRVQLESRGGRFSENGARLARYAALHEMAREKSCSVVATGHTANDVLETVLLNLARGATVGGLAGIAPHRVLDSHADNSRADDSHLLDAPINVVRPLLNVTRRETEAFCRAQKVAWRDDSSNLDLRLKRNLVRHQIVPLLEKVGHENADLLARQTVRAAQLWRDDLQFLDETANELLHQIEVRARADVIALDGLQFQRLSVSMQRRVLRLAVLQAAPAAQIGSERIDEVRRHIAANHKRIVWQWPGGVCVEWTGAMSGNRVRVWRVEKSMETDDARAETFPPGLL